MQHHDHQPVDLRPEDYDLTIASLDAEVMRLGTLMSHQVDGDANHTHYQDQVTALSAHAIALAHSRAALAAADARLVTATRRRTRVADLDANTTARLWSWTKLTGIPGLGGLVLSAWWTPTAWIPVISGVLVAAAVAIVAHGTRTRALIAEQLADADAARAAAAEQRAALRNRVARGERVTMADLDDTAEGTAAESSGAAAYGWPVAAA